MAISSALGSAAISGLSKLFQSRGTQGSQGCSKGQGAPPPPPPDGGGGIKKTINDALKSLGLDTSKLTDDSSSTSSSTSGSSDAKSAAKAFVKELFTALHAQSDAAGTAGQGGGKANFASDLKSLLSKVSGDDASSSDSTVSALKDKFSKLVSALGGSNDSATLQGVLQKLQAGVGGGSASGNLVSTAA